MKKNTALHSLTALQTFLEVQELRITMRLSLFCRALILVYVRGKGASRWHSVMHSILYGFPGTPSVLLGIADSCLNVGLWKS